MSILIYSKLEAASGNATTAHRLADHLAPLGEVTLRDPPVAIPDDPVALAAEVDALRAAARRHAWRLVVGIHCYRAGVVLRAAFGPESPLRLPILLIASGTDLNVDSQNSGRVAALQAAMAAANAVVALSPELRDKARALLGDGADVRFIAQAPALDAGSAYSLRRALGLGADQPLVLLPAGIRPVKGIAFAVEAGAQALLDFPAHVMVILGPVVDADYHAHCASLIREWSLRHRALKGRLLLRSGLPRGDYLAVLREAALLLNCSASEAVSNAVLEALGAGVPVLARDIPGNRAVIAHGENGLLFDRLPAFLREYRRLFADPGLRDTLAAGGRATYAAICDAAAERAAYLALAAGLIGAGG